ncbi:hypothetical protein CDD80_1432 [Ophiocordyceps camponoti-rufipedis]|uniref:Protein kinase domain-containing protein n=1 Tax=Ophiocordyceps camponoti-rufipedis TaxID=2004952 RepID=A0A2C5ZBK9_9HYPO|nr:hypothetical protein CDD80_1432 [Ophiocordyceps camponoti-rufipedis]
MESDILKNRSKDSLNCHLDANPYASPTKDDQTPTRQFKFVGPAYWLVKPKWNLIVEFRFRSRLIQAAAARASDVHPHVFHLDLVPSGACKQGVEWNLPSRLVLKKCKEGWDQEFNAEIAAYEKLKSLQGIVIPICYGVLEYEGTRALLLSDVGGENLLFPEGSLFSVADVSRMLRDAFTAMARLGVRQDDLKLDNFFVVDNKIMTVDLELVGTLEHDYATSNSFLRDEKCRQPNPPEFARTPARPLGSMETVTTRPFPFFWGLPMLPLKPQPELRASPSPADKPTSRTTADDGHGDGDGDGDDDVDDDDGSGSEGGHDRGFVRRPQQQQQQQRSFPANDTQSSNYLAMGRAEEDSEESEDENRGSN